MISLIWKLARLVFCTVQSGTTGNNSCSVTVESSYTVSQPGCIAACLKRQQEQGEPGTLQYGEVEVESDLAWRV